MAYKMVHIWPILLMGVRRISANYKNGKLNGLYEKWDNNGKLIVCKSYSNGKVLASRNTN